MKQMIKLIQMSVLSLAVMASGTIAAAQSSQQGQSGGSFKWAQNATDILDKKVVAKDGKEIGSVEDYVIGKDGKIESVIVKVSGAAELEEGEYAIPWKSIQSDAKVDTLVTDISQVELEKYREGESSKTAKAEKSQSQQKMTGKEVAEIEPQRARDLIDKKVMSKNDEELGTADNIYISEDGQSLYVIVQSKDDDQMRPIPADLVKKNPQKDNLKAEVDKNKFSQAPGFSEGEKPELSKSEWEQRIRGYYGDKSLGKTRKDDTRASADKKQSAESQKQAKLDKQGASPESGEIVVTQPGATVAVDQSEPQVRVKQAVPKVAVQQEPPKVTVTQPAPQITVRVRQPKPEVSVQQQQPEVAVQQEAPKVMVQHEKPEVSVQQQKPQVTVTESKPEVQIDKSSQARVYVDKQQQARVDIQKQGKPQVEVITGQQDQQRETAAKIEAADADDWLGKNLVGRNGEKIGTVKKHYLSEDGDSVLYLIIEGDENKMHPVPADLVRIDLDNNRLMAEIDKQTLQNSPSFSERENPELAKSEWEQRIRGYYGDLWR